jgi:diguanylate cyclase (GGDEF)-like protein
MGYAEIIFFCIIVVVVMFLALRSSMSRLANRNILSRLFGLVVLTLALNLLMRCFVGAEFSGAALVNSLVSCGYLVSCLWVIFLSWRFVGYTMELDFWNNRRKLLLYAIPGILGSVFVIVSIWTGWAFVIGENNAYARGPFFAAYLACCYVYLAWMCLVAGRRAFMKRFYADRLLYISLASFGAFPIVGILVQTLYPDIPGAASAMVISTLLAFLTTQSRMISTDPLTKLNNRNQLNSFLDAKLRQATPDKKFCFFVLDVDNFKSINDNFGHMEGDRALNLVAKILKKTCGPRGCFISRFGGDEFNLVAMFGVRDTPADIYVPIREALALESQSLPYTLSVSIGYAESLGKEEMLPDLFARADEVLYAEKKAKKQKKEE